MLLVNSVLLWWLTCVTRRAFPSLTTSDDLCHFFTAVLKGLLEPAGECGSDLSVRVVSNQDGFRKHHLGDTKLSSSNINPCPASPLPLPLTTPKTTSRWSGGLSRIESMQPPTVSLANGVFKICFSNQGRFPLQSRKPAMIP